MHTRSLLKAQEVYVTDLRPKRVLFSHMGLVVIFRATLCSRDATKVTEEYALGKPLSLLATSALGCWYM